MIKIKEIVKEIEDFPGYFISNKGNVYCNLGKGCRNKNKTVPMYLLKPRITKGGYSRVYMRQCSTNKRVDRYIHRLVAENFISNPQNKKYVNHIDCTRTHNDVTNLEWSTAKENTSQTEKLGHIIRDKTGRFVSNFNYFEEVRIV